MSSAFNLARRVRAGETFFIAWVATPDPLVAETLARSGFDAINLDMQHGLHDPISIMQGIGAVVAAGKPAIVRVPVDDFAMASRALDMGAEAVIAPMVNSAADARAFADAMKYPPLGRRSWGPTRAMTLQGISAASGYAALANAETLSLAMIETQEALDDLDAILAVDGIDGIFVGPSDLSLTLSNGAIIDANHPSIDDPIRRIAAATLKAGKIPAIFAGGGARAKQFASFGYTIIAVGSDSGVASSGGGYIAVGARAMLAEARG
jgi:4-hydroxy-2-oxoheptanedioate aldolase